MSRPGLTASSEADEASKALVRRWFEETDRANPGIIDELLPEDYLDHNPPLPDLPRGREGVRRSVMLLAAKGVDLRVTTFIPILDSTGHCDNFSGHA